MNKIKTLIIVLICLFLTGCGNKELNEYTKEFNYFNSDISIKLYTTSSDKANNAFDKIEDIYKTYEEILDRFNSNSEIFYIYNNNSNDSKIKISTYMNNLIEYGIKLYKDSYGFLSINTGDIVDIWNNDYKNNVLPSSKELKNINTSIDKINVNNNVMDNNHINLYFDNFIKGYINKSIKEYLMSINIDYYFINTGNEVLVGNGIDNTDYVVVISSPFDDSVLKVFNLQNKYITTKSIYYNSYKYDNEVYSNLVNAKEKIMANNMISITVVSDDVYTSELVANMLFMNDYYDGLDIAKKYNVQVIWCYKDNLGKDVIKTYDYLN